MEPMTDSNRKEVQMRKGTFGFTLIELLIVVAIIGILAAIAVPNFLNAQIRARVAHSQSELRAYKDVQKLYLMDVGDVPGHYDGKEEHCPYVNLGYLNGPLTDPFMEGRDDLEYFKNHQGMYHNTALGDLEFMRVNAPALYEEWRGAGFGYLIYGEGPVCCGFPNIPYDASNGIRSNGVIISPGVKGRGQPGSNLAARQCK